MKSLFGILILSVLVFLGCGNKNPGKSTMSSDKPEKEAAIETSSEDPENPTYVGPMTIEELGSFLPDALENFPVASKIGNVKQNFGEEIYIDVLRQYRIKEDALEYIQITLSDYGHAPQMYSVKEPTWDENGAYETESIKFTIVKISGENARLKDSKKNKYKDIIMGVDNRFILSIQGNQENFDMFIKTLESIVEKLKGTR